MKSDNPLKEAKLLNALFFAAPLSSALTKPISLCAIYDENYYANYVDTHVNCGFTAHIIGTYTDSRAIVGQVGAFVNVGLLSNVDAKFDINFIRGLNHYGGFSFQKTLSTQKNHVLKHGRATHKSHNNAFIFEHGLTISNFARCGFDQSNILQQMASSVFEDTTGLEADPNLTWQETKKRLIGSTFIADVTTNLGLQRKSDWDELIRKRKVITCKHEVSHVFDKRFSYAWDRGLELVTNSEFLCDKAKSIHYRKNEITPWPKPDAPEFKGSGDLNFTCLCTSVDSHNVILNFGADDCILGLPVKKWWHILNNLSVHRLDNGEEIKALDGNYDTDRNSWCWSYSLTVPASEILKLESISGQPVVLSISVNGTEHHMLLESRTRSRRFAQDTYTLSGRSQSALLDAPYSPVRSFLQENERTARQLCQAELDRVNSPIQLKWELIDELSWILPINSLSYSGLTPIAAIKLIAESAGGFVYSEKSGQVITVKSKYKKTFWDSISIDEYERLIPLSLATAQSIDDALYPDYNGITLTNDRSGVTGQVRRTGTAADVLLETVNNPLFTVESMGVYGKTALAKAGMVETHSLTLPIAPEVGECSPAELTAFDAEWWGITDAVSVSFSHSVVTQSIKVERVKHE
ncbi:hypothetical protein [Acinetobacter chinensis]|uniref:hypothetical protein n=1 Tax=Acinetobacter chinensis TaxID=2004650 RepID=UPI0029352CC1|nr:hypothetical protein [Acinetobacter chinensis]WOE40682.1 hypothetical protein QSG87_12415 [Acinetobacter chinensis]